MYYDSIMTVIMMSDKDAVFVLEINESGLANSCGLFRGRLAPPVRGISDGNSRRHLTCLQEADARLLFDAAPQIVCVWARTGFELTSGIRRNESLSWHDFCSKFPLPVDWTQRYFCLRPCVAKRTGRLRFLSGGVEDFIVVKLRTNHT